MFFIAGILFLATGAVTLNAQIVFTANDDYAKTGPWQKIRVNVVGNDVLICNDYGLDIVSTLNPLTQGTATPVPSQGIIEFMPGPNSPGTTVQIQYDLICGSQTRRATLFVEVSHFNTPVNIIPDDLECYSIMATNINFGTPKLKYTTATTGNVITGVANQLIGLMTSPMVGDLNGDGKPEIVVIGVNAQGTGVGAVPAADYRYIMVYDGQTGRLLCKQDLGGNYTMGDVYHPAPSSLALADVNNDGLGEIVVATTNISGTGNNGLLRCYKPLMNSNDSIIGLSEIWRGHDQTGATVNFAAPQTVTASLFTTPMPYIADLNGDGIPEVIVYNKIFNGATGRLLMSWQGPTTQAAPLPSSTTDSNGLSTAANMFWSSPTTQTNANTIKSRAMMGMRRGSNTYLDRYIAVPEIIDIDGDGQQEIITGSRIHKFNFNSLTDHIQNTYYTIEGPASVTIPEGGVTPETHYLSDGFTRVADFDGDGKLDVLVVTTTTDGSYVGLKVLIYIYDPLTMAIKAATTFYSNGQNGTSGIPFIGDINGKKDGWDGTGYKLKLPEICLIGNYVYTNRATVNGGRSGLPFHPLADSELTTKNFTQTNTTIRRIIGITYDASEANVENRLKICWAMEHTDTSHNTSMTLFDFDNNNTFDICYRDETTLRVISPAIGNNGAGRDYVPAGELPNHPTTNPNSSTMFSTPAYSGTGFEYPTIADVNMDGSADIIVTSRSGFSSVATHGFIQVFEYATDKWAPCPPVWNQGMYNPTQVREDLKINARPISMLTEFVKNGETIRPYNGSWIQQPIVKEDEGYVPIVRKPDAHIRTMRVSVSGSTVTVTLTIANTAGTASINANTLIAFYNGGLNGDPIGGGATFVTTMQVGVDIFPGEIVTRTYTLTTGGPYSDRLIWARIMDNGTNFPPVGYDDCDLSNNTARGSDCPYMNGKVKISPDSPVYIYGTSIMEAATLKITALNGASFPFKNPPVFVWYKDYVIIPGANDSIYKATAPGFYYCYVEDGICSDYTDPVEVKLRPPIGPRVYVRASGPPGNGTSWASPYPNLSYPLRLAYENRNEPYNQKIKEIWVAEGVYYPGHYPADLLSDPTAATQRDFTFYIPDSVKVYGGFPAGLTASADGDFSRRDPSKYSATILSGDIDGVAGRSNGDAFHVVVVIDSATNVSTLDGFLIRGGNANGTKTNNEGLADDIGGGMYLKNSGIILKNLFFDSNYADAKGGGLAINNNAKNRMFLENFTVRNNTAGGTSGVGGGISVVNVATDTTFFKNLSLTGNTATSNGGGIIFSGAGHVTFVNTLMAQNTGAQGAGIYATQSFNMVNSTVAKNTATSGGSGINGTSLILHNSIVWGNSGTTNNIVGTITNGQRNITNLTTYPGTINTADPFVNFAGNDFHPKGIPINRGLNSLYLNAFTPVKTSFAGEVDLDGRPRAISNGVTLNGVIDIGAFENQDGKTENAAIISNRNVTSVIK